MTFGESHGPAVGVVIEGVPPNLALTEKDIQIELDRRRPGQSDVSTPRQEKDQAEILSGIFEGRTLGTPVAILIRNEGQESGDYKALKDILRPGHADYTTLEKYGIRDHRGGGRASGRETAARVAAGAIAKKILEGHNIKVMAYTIAVGQVTTDIRDLNAIEKNPVRCPDSSAASKMAEAIHKARDEKDSLGGVIEVLVKGCPSGLGDPVFDKLQARLGQGLLSIGGVRGIEFGDGFASARMKGSQHNDAFEIKGGRILSATNHCGGIQGGISNGGDILLRLAVKPTSSISRKQMTVSTKHEPSEIAIEGRHDPCLCPRIVPVAEAMVALTLADGLLLQKTLR